MKIVIKSAIGTILLLLFLVFPQHEVESSPKNDVELWATKFGDELRRLAEIMTKSTELKNSYSKKARVEKKNGTLLMDSIVENIGRMLNRKMDAVKCIVNKSEEFAKEFHPQFMDDIEYDEKGKMIFKNLSYYSSKFSMVNGLNLANVKLYTNNTNTSIEAGFYLNMSMDRDSHFYDLNVNTSYSSVHVPTNVYDGSLESREFIEWSEVLDEVFTQNYRTDPALSWQYFGSNLGIMRHYPALAWNRNATDTYDCRKRNWYIETATCSKDVVILFDNSGSMKGYRSYVAKLTMKYLLDTFSNNDFISVLTYSKDTTTLVECFNNTLVQATPENIEFFNRAINENLPEPEGYANITIALKEAFKLLEYYRELRNCSSSEAGCNQEIMLVTDGVPGNATDVFEEYNYLNSNTTSPVRVFTFLLGKEVTKVREIQLYACLNRGYYSHVQSLDEVAEGVLKYVNVIAAPLVLQRVEHPPTWTHAYIDTTYLTDSEASSDDKDDFRLMIAVGVPAFNLSSYSEGNYTGRPSLLGVAGTDVPIDEIIKLALPYKIGVNGYSFIVSNNGYVLLHPDLRPFDKKMNQTMPNYNSIDFTEVEFVDYEEYNITNKNMTLQRDSTNNNDDDISSNPLKYPRVPSVIMEEIREYLVEHRKGSMLNVSVLYDYDNMRRIEKSRQDYYFAPIPHTPFSLGIALPHDYGNTWIKVGDVIKENKFTRVNISDYFVGENWKIHPDWVYCKYHYLEGHEFNNSELELKEFLRKIFEPEWKWSVQYEPDAEADEEHNPDQLNCGRKSLDDDSYYCNKELVELLVFDAKVTNESYQTWTFKSEEDREIVGKYDANVRFIATMSGLTRWQFIFGEVEVDSDKEFGDFHSSAIEEPWYKSAILQHQIDKDSFVYSVAHQDDVSEGNETQVIASMAIFPRDGGLEAPSCVVGFQFSRDLMYQRFMEITSNVNNCEDCIKSCGDDEQICYVIDNNGYIIISEENSTESGRFFGEVERPVMEVLVNENIFKKFVIYDLQSLCSNTTEENTSGSSATDLMTPIRLFMLAFKWMIAELFIEFSRISSFVASHALPDLEADYGNVEDEEQQKMQEKIDTSKKTKITKVPKGSSIADEEWFDLQKLNSKKNVTKYYSCDKKSELYVLQPHGSIKDKTFSLDVPTNGSRPFYVHKIPHSNLLLVVINKMDNPVQQPVYTDKMTTKMQELEYVAEYGSEFPCHKLYLNDLRRRRLTECFTEHPDEEETSYCGSATKITQTTLLVLMPMSMYYLIRFL